MSTELLLEAAPIRSVIVHYHIYKNAGSTIESILEREFGESFYRVHRDRDEGVVGPDDIGRLLAKAPDLRAVTSHHFAFPVPRIAQTAIFDCCPIRDPFDRFTSIHRYLRSVGQTDPLGLLALRTTLPEFLRALIDGAPNYIHNVQTQILSGNFYSQIPNAEALRTAIGVVRRSGIPAVVDRLDESLTVAEYFMRPAFPKLQLHYVARNVTVEGFFDRAEREERFFRICGRTLVDEVCRHNEFDLALYDAANAELDRRIRLVPDFDDRLAEFRGRADASISPVRIAERSYSSKGFS